MKKTLLSALLGLIISTTLQASYFPVAIPLDDLSGIVEAKKFTFSTGATDITLDLVGGSDGLELGQITGIQRVQETNLAPDLDDDGGDQGYTFVGYKLQTLQDRTWSEYTLLFIENLGTYTEHMNLVPAASGIIEAILTDLHRDVILSLQTDNADSPDHPVHSIAFPGSVDENQMHVEGLHSDEFLFSEGGELDIGGLAISLESLSSDDGDGGIIDD